VRSGIDIHFASRFIWEAAFRATCNRIHNPHSAKEPVHLSSRSPNHPFPPMKWWHCSRPFQSISKISGVGSAGRGKTHGRNVAGFYVNLAERNGGGMAAAPRIQGSKATRPPDSM